MFPDIGFTIKRINFEEESHVLIVENTLFVSLELLDIDLFQTYGGFQVEMFGIF